MATMLHAGEMEVASGTNLTEIDFVHHVIEECNTSIRALGTLFHADDKRPSFVEQEENDLRHRIEQMEHLKVEIMTRGDSSTTWTFQDPGPDEGDYSDLHHHPPAMMSSLTPPIHSSLTPPSPGMEQFSDSFQYPVDGSGAVVGPGGMLPLLTSSPHHYHQHQHQHQHQQQQQQPPHSPLPGKEFIRAHLPHDQKTTIQATPGMSLFQALQKALKKRNLDPSTCQVFLYNAEQEKKGDQLEWAMDTSLLAGQSIKVVYHEAFQKTTTIRHNFKPEKFLLQKCNYCKKALFNGFRCTNCRICFHQKCSAFVPQHCNCVGQHNLFKMMLNDTRLLNVRDAVLPDLSAEEAFEVATKKGPLSRNRSISSPNVYVDTVGGNGNGNGNGHGNGSGRGHKTDRPDLLLPDDSLPPLSPSPPTPPPPTWKEQYEKAIEQQGSVTLYITRCVLIGPPRVGKSSLKLLLISNEPPDQHVEKSTDLMEAPVVLTSIQCQEGNGSQWKELTPNNLQQLVTKCTREEGYDLAQPNSIQSSHSSQLTPEESISYISTAFTSDTDNVSTPVAESSNIFTDLVDSELERRYHDFVETTMSEESLAELEINGLKMVHVFDCGGQLAFQDTIPLLINAPCSFISVFNASVDLDEEMELKYCPEKGKELDRGHKESQWNILRRIFSSIHSLQFKCHEDILHLIKGIKVVPSSPIAVVGTHKDVLHKASERDGGLRQRSTEKKIKERLEQLRESKLYDFIREKGCTYDLVANLSKEDLSDINSLRKDIERKATLPLELPLSWIILELFTRHSLLENKFIPIHDLHQLCILKNIVSHKKEFLSLLQVLHVLGFYAFYELDGVPEDQNWVCTDAATLYREVTKLLMVQYKENFRKGATTELKLLGRIKLNKATLEDIFSDLEVNISGADPMWFIRVLIHIGLAAKIENEGEEEVFIPLALPFKRSDFPPVTSVATICFTLEFPCGANKGRVRANVIEIPRGIFPRLIVHLLSQQRSGEFEWLVNKGDSCSWIKLIHHSYKYVIYLNEHVDHIELALVLNDTFFVTLHNVMHNTQVGHLCRKLRKQLKSALGATFGLVFGEQPLERKPSPVCGLKCSVCRDSPHMAIVRPADESTPQHPLPTEKCVHKGLPKTIKNPDQLIWFSPVKETTFERKETTCGDKQWTIWVMKGTGTSKSDVTVVESVSDLMPYYMDMTAHLFELAAALEVVEFSKALINGHGTPEDKCLQILDHWLESTPSPTWTLLCQKLRSVSSFKAVVHKIATDHNLPTAD